MDTLLFYVFLGVHIISLIIGMGAVLVIDTAGVLWLLKKTKLSSVMSMARLTQPLIWIGWSGLVISGSVLLTLKGSVDALTKLKLFLVLMVGLNGFFLHLIKKSMESIKGEHVPAKLMFKIALASAISQIGWWGAIVIGFLHRHWRHHIDWPSWL